MELTEWWNSDRGGIPSGWNSQGVELPEKWKSQGNCQTLKRSLADEIKCTNKELDDWHIKDPEVLIDLGAQHDKSTQGPFHARGNYGSGVREQAGVQSTQDKNSESQLCLQECFFWFLICLVLCLRLIVIAYGQTSTMPNPKLTSNKHQTRSDQARPTSRCAHTHPSTG